MYAHFHQDADALSRAVKQMLGAKAHEASKRPGLQVRGSNEEQMDTSESCTPQTGRTAVWPERIPQKLRVLIVTSMALTRETTTHRYSRRHRPTFTMKCVSQGRRQNQCRGSFQLLSTECPNCILGLMQFAAVLTFYSYVFVSLHVTSLTFTAFVWDPEVHMIT